MSKRWIRTLLVGAMLAIGVGSAQASLLYNNLPDSPSLGDNPSMGTSTTLNGYFDAVGFTVDSSSYYQITAVTLLMKDWAGVSSPVVSLWSDSNGEGPGTQLGTFSNPAPSIPTGNLATPGLVSFNATSNLIVNPLGSYWITLSGADITGDFGWSFTDATVPSGLWDTHVFIDNGVFAAGTPYTIDAAQPYQMEITANAVPEPSTYILLTISLGAIGFARKRMSKKEL